MNGRHSAPLSVHFALRPILCPYVCASRMYNAPRRYLFCLVLLSYSYIWLVTGTVCVYDNVTAMTLCLLWTRALLCWFARDVGLGLGNGMSIIR